MAGKTGLMPSKEDGSCVYLNGENQCDIYEDRPEICNVRQMYRNRTQKGLKMSYRDYCIESTKACHKIIEEMGLSKRYKIDIREYDDA